MRISWFSTNFSHLMHPTRYDEGYQRVLDNEYDAIILDIMLPGKVDFPRDMKDAKFLACAIAAGADFFITGDADFNEAQTLLNTTIISLSLFKRLVCDVRE